MSSLSCSLIDDDGDDVVVGIAVVDVDGCFRFVESVVEDAVKGFPTANLNFIAGGAATSDSAADDDDDDGEEGDGGKGAEKVYAAAASTGAGVVMVEEEVGRVEVGVGRLNVAVVARVTGGLGGCPNNDIDADDGGGGVAKVDRMDAAAAVILGAAVPAVPAPIPPAPNKDDGNDTAGADDVDDDDEAADDAG